MERALRAIVVSEFDLLARMLIIWSPILEQAHGSNFNGYTFEFEYTQS